MPDLDDTQPKRPAALPTPHPQENAAAFAPRPSSPLLAFDPTVPLLDPDEVPTRGWLGWLPILAVLGLGSCMCLAIVALSGFAGVRDELRSVKTAAVQEQQAYLATQYAEANAEITNENYELALLRLQYIMTLEPNYRDVPQLLAQVEQQGAITPTTTPAPTESDAGTPSESGTAAPTPTDDPLNPEKMFIQGQTNYNVGLYEEAIEWFDALRQTNPTYRSAEVEEMLRDSLVKQGLIYLQGSNQDGSDQLARGVVLMQRAGELGYQGDGLYEADFVDRYISARAYISGGLNEQALPILTQLCSENCSWGYHGTTICQVLQSIGASCQ